MIEIRELRDGDLESISRELRETPSVYQNWVAVEGERVIGFLSLLFYKTLFHRRNGFDEEYVLLGMGFHRRADARADRGGE